MARESWRWSGVMHVSLKERKGTAPPPCSILLTNGNGQERQVDLQIQWEALTWADSSWLDPPLCRTGLCWVLEIYPISTGQCQWGLITLEQHVDSSSCQWSFLFYDYRQITLLHIRQSQTQTTWPYWSFLNMDLLSHSPEHIKQQADLRRYRPMTDPESQRMLWDHFAILIVLFFRSQPVGGDPPFALVTHCPWCWEVSGLKHLKKDFCFAC